MVQAAPYRRVLLCRVLLESPVDLAFCTSLGGAMVMHDPGWRQKLVARGLGEASGTARIITWIAVHPDE